MDDPNIPRCKVDPVKFNNPCYNRFCGEVVLCFEKNNEFTRNRMANQRLSSLSLISIEEAS